MNKRKLLLSYLLFAGLTIVLVACGTAKLTEYSDLNTQNENLSQATVESTAEPSATTDLWWKPTLNSDTRFHYQLGRGFNSQVWNSNLGRGMLSYDDLTLLSQNQDITVIAVDTEYPADSYYYYDDETYGPVYEHADFIRAVQYGYASPKRADEIPDTRAQQKHVICYISAGTYEPWRVDKTLFPTSLFLGGYSPPFEDEIYLDVRTPEKLAELESSTKSEDAVVLRHVMAARILWAKSKGCDAVDPDNVDIWWVNDELEQEDLEAYLVWMSDLAHYGLTDLLEENQSDLADFRLWLDNEISKTETATDQAYLNSYLTTVKTYVDANVISTSSGTVLPIEISIGLKNASTLAPEMSNHFDWAINESCATDQYQSCSAYTDTFIAKNKPVYWIEYSGSLDDYCSLTQPNQEAEGMTLMLSKPYVMNFENKDYDIPSYRLVADITRADRCAIATPPPQVDKTPPTITASFNPEVPANGWYGNDVDAMTVSFSCTDADSGIDQDSVTQNILVSEEGVTAVEGNCSDNAGNAATPLVLEVKLDKQLPTVEVKGATFEEASCEVQDQEGLSGINESNTILTPNESEQKITCFAEDNAGNSAEVSKVFETAPPPPPPPSSTELYSTDFDNLNGWEKCWSQANLPTISGSVAHFAGRKNSQGGTDCAKERVVINSQNVASSYTLTCEAKRSLGGRVELELYQSGLRSQGTLQQIQPTEDDNFQTYTLDLLNPNNLTKNIWIRIKAQRKNVGSNVVREADLFVDSCTLVANN